MLTLGPRSLQWTSTFGHPIRTLLQIILGPAPLQDIECLSAVTFYATTSEDEGMASRPRSFQTCVRSALPNPSWGSQVFWLNHQMQQWRME